MLNTNESYVEPYSERTKAQGNETPDPANL